LDACNGAYCIWKDLFVFNIESVLCHKYKKNSCKKLSVSLKIEFLPFKETTYDAYEKDIAVLQVYFKTPTVMEYQTFPSRSWIDFFSAIGGLLGLRIGLSIVTFVELFWLVLRIGANLIKPLRRQRIYKT
jgi:hypothetical protein